MQHDEIYYQIIRQLSNEPGTSQRQLASTMGISLGKANYCLKALLDKGLLKAERFKSSQNKVAYLYLLTPKGVEAKAKLTKQFLAVKQAEYERIKEEIALLQSEVANEK